MSARDSDELSRILDDDITIFGTASANVDSAQSLAYLGNVLAQPVTIRWEWRQVLPLAAQDDVLCFAVVGTVGWDGAPDAERDPFRLTCVAVRDGERWRLRHFHGSVPQT